MKGHDRRSDVSKSLFWWQLSRGLRRFAWSNIKKHHAEDSIGLLQSSIDHQLPFHHYLIGIVLYFMHVAATL